MFEGRGERVGGLIAIPDGKIPMEVLKRARSKQKTERINSAPSTLGSNMSYELVMTTDIEYVWYHAIKNEIQVFHSTGHLILTGYAFTNDNIVFLGEL